MENPCQMDDLGVPQFQETSMWKMVKTWQFSWGQKRILSVYPIDFLGNFVTKAAVMELKVLCLPHDFAQSWVRGWLTVLLSCLSAQNYSNYTILYVYLGLNLPNQTITLYSASVSKSSWEFQYIRWNNIKQVHRSWCPTVALAWVSNNVHLHDEKIM
jgi:hypothetical protein